jgi:hypothetical protein
VSTWSSCSLLHAQHGTVLPLCPPLWIGVLSVVRLPHFNHGHGFWPFLAACRWFHRCGLAHWSCFEHNSALHGNLTHHQPSMHGPLLQGVHCIKCLRSRLPAGGDRIYVTATACTGGTASFDCMEYQWIAKLVCVELALIEFQLCSDCDMSWVGQDVSRLHAKKQLQPLMPCHCAALTTSNSL